MDKGAVLDGSEHSALFNGDGRGARCVCWTLNRLFELQNEEHLKTSTCYFDRAELSYTGGSRQRVAARLESGMQFQACDAAA